MVTIKLLIRQYPNTIFSLALWCLVLALSAPVIAQVNNEQLVQIKLAAPQTARKATQGLEIEFSLKNISSLNLSILKWRTPLEGKFNNDMFSVLHNGSQVQYTGRVVKRAPPSPADYITLIPGQVVTASVNLDKAYAISTAGNYSVTYRTQNLEIKTLHDNNKAQKRVAKSGFYKVDSNTITIVLAEDRSLSAITLKQPPAFSQCNSSQISILNNALTQAESISKTALDDLTNAPVAERTNATRFTTWFGSYNSGHYATVNNNFSKINDALANKTITFLCDCNENFFAFVYPAIPYEIHLCNAFWAADLTGTDSQAGTIVHEVSHFTVVAGTDDFAYGQTACKTLAISSPQQAIQNADSHEYFAENTPFLNMPDPIVLPPPAPESPDNSHLVPIIQLLL